jgi:hypothetical protein
MGFAEEVDEPISVLAACFNPETYIEIAQFPVHLGMS